MPAGLVDLRAARRVIELSGACAGDGGVRRLSGRQQCGRDLFPLGLERGAADCLAGAVVPVGSVARVPFFPVQVGMNPRACRIIDVLGDSMGRVPVSTGVVPERQKGSGK